MTKIHFQNLRSKKFPDKKSKIWNFHFLNWLFEENFSRKKIGRKIFFDRFFFSKNFLRKVNLKNENFKFSIFCPEIFSISNFENGFSSWKINIFHPIFFSYKVSSYHIGKQHRRWAYLTYRGLARVNVHEPLNFAK